MLKDKLDTIEKHRTEIVQAAAIRSVIYMYMYVYIIQLSSPYNLSRYKKQK